jgi:outer membrane protein OmpA-like peptidoglycan-associated protein
VSIVPTKAPIETGKPVALYNILFDVGKSEIKPESFDYLDSLVDYFLLIPELHIEISGHTDNIGSNDENEKLSLARAIAVKRYLAIKGVAADRISVKGYGASKPIADNNTSEGRSKNRRIEIVVE